MAKQSGSDPKWAPELCANVLKASLPLRADLEVIETTLSTVLAFEPGAVLYLSDEGLSNLSLTDARGGRVLAGRLGQSGGKRAVAIRENPYQITSGLGNELPQPSQTDPAAAPAVEPGGVDTGAAKEPSAPESDIAKNRQEEDLSAPAAGAGSLSIPAG